MALEHLFSPIRLGSMAVKNRLVMPPMSLNFGVDQDGCVTQQHWEYLAARAKGGAGMIVVGGGAVHPSGLDLPRMPRLWSDRFIEALTKMTEHIHAYDTKFGMQLLHGGRQAYLSEKVAPSAIPSLAVVKGLPRELTQEEIRQLVAAYGDAALRCQRAGFDFVEIHGAHGYLITEFLAGNSNLRQDKYGGSFENRTRFLIEIIEDIQTKVGPGYPVGVRINGEDYVEGGWTLEDAKGLAPVLEGLGIDWLHVSAGVYGSMPVTIPSMYADHGCFVHLAEEVKRTVSIPVIAVGRIKEPELADGIIGEGRADMVAMGRALLADPELPQKAYEGRLTEIRPCIGCCKGCIARALALEEGTCVVNPEVGREYLLNKKEKMPPPRKILVVGAGPAGLAVATMAALRGHEVIVLDEKSQAGGMARLASIPPGRSEIMDIIEYYLRQLDRLNVDVRFDVAPDKDLIAAIRPDVGIITTGSLPEIPQIAGLFDTAMALHTITDVLQFHGPLGHRVVVLGGNMAALQVADFLAEKGREVFVLHRGEHFAEQMAPNDRTYLMERLKRPGVELLKGVSIEGFLEKGIRFLWQGQVRQLDMITDIVLAEGMRPNRRAAELFKDANLEVHTIGDAKAPRTLFEALAEADELGRAL
ncbi:MAG: FAD-dependent oxidoreductase [Thermodesulfobacteriota bacterium]|nr:FAD-dependent oxidoreductase [Thermodesulfobacteriota bacterium]